MDSTPHSLKPAPANWAEIIADSAAEANAGLVVPGELVRQNLRDSIERMETRATDLPLLQQSEVEVAAFVQSLEGARTESDRDGWLSAEDVHAEMAALIGKAGRAKM